MVYDNNGVYSTDDVWFINEFHSRTKDAIAGKCISSSWPFAADSIYLSTSDLERVVICIAIDNIDTIHETHPHLFI